MFVCNQSLVVSNIWILLKLLMKGLVLNMDGYIMFEYCIFCNGKKGVYIVYLVYFIDIFDMIDYYWCCCLEKIYLMFF